MEVKMIDMKDIVTNPLQPRQTFDREKLQELADSIKEGELLQPIVVRSTGKKFEIVCGERRYKAFQILKEPKIPAIVRMIKDDTDALEKSLIENLQRDDLTSVERENAVSALWDSKRYKTHEELAKKLGIDRSAISTLIRENIARERLGFESPTISTSSLRATEGLSDEPRKKVLEQIEKGNLPATHEKVLEIVNKVKEFPEPEQQMEILEEFERKEKWGKKTFDEIIQQKKEISEGKRHPEVIIKENKYEAFVEQMEYDFEKTLSYGIANISTLPKIHKDKAVKIIMNTIGYLLRELKKIDEKKFNQLRGEVD